jgi:2-methylcitrate dehydratase PrpD
VELSDGRVLTRETAIVRGDAANPRSHDELKTKFRSLASEALATNRVDEIVATVARLENLPDVRTLTALCAA